MHRLVLLLVVTALLAGCSDSDSKQDPGESTAPPDPTNTGTPAPPQEVTPVNFTLFLHPDLSLTGVPGDEGSVPLASTTHDYFTGGDPTIWTTSEIGATLQVPTASITVNLWVQSAELSTPEANGVDWFIWFGSGQHMASSIVVSDGATIQPNTPHRVQATLDMPGNLGFLVAKGGAFELHVATGRGIQDESMTILTGGNETNSQVTFPVLALLPDPLVTSAAPTSESFSGTLTNVLFPVCTGPEGIAQTMHDIVVEANASYLRLDLTSNANDLDLELWLGDTLASRSYSMRPNEGMLLAGPTFQELQGQTLQARILGCISVNASYELIATQAQP